MLRLVHDVPRWHVYLHREARDLPSVQQDDTAVRKLEDELFDRLYAGPSEVVGSNADEPLAQWAQRIHTLAAELPAFERLSNECIGDADASATAVEKLLEALTPHLRSPADAMQPAQLRRTMNVACEKTSESLEKQREAVEGLGGVGFGSSPSQPSSSNGASPRRLAQRLKNDQRLARIAHLAGRFRRIAAAKQKTKVRHGADEITDIELGSVISRLVPSELAQFAHPTMRRALLARLVEDRATQYRLSGTHALGRGPIVVCLDKSGSMDGPKDTWATAVALALLDVAQRQRRAFALLGFDESVKSEVHVDAGGQLPEAALFTNCSGGTNIAVVLARALNIVRESTTSLKEADVVLITDGESDRQDAPLVRHVAQQFGVTIIGLGIGVAVDALNPWCDEAHAIHRLDAVEDAAAEALFTL